MNIEAIPTLKTNYVWLLRPDPGNRRAYIVDPGEAEPVLARLKALGLELAGILITHHHWDHTDGLDPLLARLPVPVYGPGSVRQVDHPLTEGDRLALDGVTFQILAIPGHTLDHIAYLQKPEAGQPAALLCGDALFAGGCGRLFEGTPEQALGSLKKLANLPGTTLVYCGHEYTLANLRFARKAEPDNRALIERQQREQRKLDATGITLPTNLAQELATNPFLRCREVGVKTQVAAWQGRPLSTEVEVFAALRRWKDAS